ncbi:hypothetical protein I546_0718 [Mycobacterium kansasii 732]|uniref:DUF2784 domain-containing protein n=1 Tax=Mycobacterium pseudokansasii TaxID=2341080 RepID=A0A498QNK3_9MYCO|nr:DUF2784 domain-containing protein [Mycobacterium pseudokansasii]EUA14732.1 hypothetical protein I546_0718 [Mycobacterium kansasii 732]VBA47554.1 hypothetical protein LAUMK142_00816 [Mycobacterium pseudokansasii]
MYIAVVVAAVAVHFAHLAYLVAGGFVALRWPRTIACHALAVGWSMVSVTEHLNCPLTGLERWGRAHAGMAPLSPDGFIAHYITGVVYPSEWSVKVAIAVFTLVAISWLLVVGWQVRCRTAHAKRRRRAPGLLEITG